MLLSGKLKPATVIVPLLVALGVLVLPQAAATVTSTASAANNQVEPASGSSTVLLPRGGFPDSTDAVCKFFHLRRFKGGCSARSRGFEQADPTRHQQLFEAPQRHLGGQS